MALGHSYLPLLAITGAAFAGCGGQAEPPATPSQSSSGPQHSAQSSGGDDSDPNGWQCPSNAPVIVIDVIAKEPREVVYQNDSEIEEGARVYVHQYGNHNDAGTVNATAYDLNADGRMDLITRGCVRNDCWSAALIHCGDWRFLSVWDQDAVHVTDDHTDVADWTWRDLQIPRVQQADGCWVTKTAKFNGRTYEIDPSSTKTEC